MKGKLSLLQSVNTFKLPEPCYPNKFKSLNQINFTNDSNYIQDTVNQIYFTLSDIYIYIKRESINY